MEASEEAFLRTFGERIAARRAELGLRQVDVYQHIGVSKATFINLEHGRIGEGSVGVLKLIRLADILKLSVGDLLDDSRTQAMIAPGRVLVDSGVIDELQGILKTARRGKLELAQSLWDDLQPEGIPVAHAIPHEFEVCEDGDPRVEEIETEAIVLSGQIEAALKAARKKR